jgi:hypothetical protein
MEKKPDPVEEAHFRIDEHERALSDIKRALTPDNVAAVAHGAVAMLTHELEKRLKEQMEAQFSQLIKAVRADVETDRMVSEGLKELVAQLKEQAVQETDTEEDKALLTEIRELIRTLRTPITRTATVELPNGHATMTVRERKDS